MKYGWRILSAFALVGMVVWCLHNHADRGAVGDGILIGLLFAEVFLRRRQPAKADGILLDGWTCAKRGCGAFNGTANKPERTSCRSCGAPR